MPNIGAFIAWGFITALFHSDGLVAQCESGAARRTDAALSAAAADRHDGGTACGRRSRRRDCRRSGDGRDSGQRHPDVHRRHGDRALCRLGDPLLRPLGGGTHSAGFEMLVNNFSVGILGIVCALIGFYAVGPVVSALTVFLSAGVSLMIEHGLLPLVAVFIEPAKVLFLNNAINHGIFSPIGIEQARQTGQSIMFLLETNPGRASASCWPIGRFARGAARSSAPGAIVIQFFGGIHEIYFPYVLMRPAIIVAPIVGSAAAILFYSLTGTGLTAVASPGSIIAVAAMAPKGDAAGARRGGGRGSRVVLSLRRRSSNVRIWRR